MLSTEEVARFISPPPTTVEGFERFIAWTHRERAAGNYACFAVVPHGMDTAIGIFQVRQLEPGFGTAEWGFAIGSAFWGTGVFMDGARMVVDFAFDTIGTHRLEARAAILNGRGNGALRKIGAMQEGILRKSFLRNGEYLDQALWTILDEDWRAAARVYGVQAFTKPVADRRVGALRATKAPCGWTGADSTAASAFLFWVGTWYRFRCESAAVFPPMPTPFKDGEVDRAAIRATSGAGWRPDSAASSRSAPTAKPRCSTTTRAIACSPRRAPRSAGTIGR